MMIRHWLTVFGVCCTICSNRGPQFTCGWFRVMCSLMGIRHAKSATYLSWSNGRAEVAGRQLSEKLRKIYLTNKRRNWFEEMWPALKSNHDTPAPGGLSPHQILFGRDPLGRELPLSGKGMAMDAKEFFLRQENTARDICQQLQKEQAVRAKTASKSAAQKFRVGASVWVLRPRPTGTHGTSKPGSHPKKLFAGLVRTPTPSKCAPDSSENDMRINSMPVTLMSMRNMCPWTIQPMRPTRTTTMLSSMTTPSRRSWPSV